jgi:hypothetical protein
MKTYFWPFKYFKNQKLGVLILVWSNSNYLKIMTFGEILVSCCMNSCTLWCRKVVAIAAEMNDVNKSYIDK